MSLVQFTRRSIWVTTILIEMSLLIGQAVTDQFSFTQVLHWPPPILIPFFGALCIVFGDTKQIRKCSGALFVIGCLYWCIHDWKPQTPINHEQLPFTFMHWTVEEGHSKRAEATLQVASSYETDFLCLVNINTLLRLPRKEVFAHLPHQKVQWPFLFASKWPLTCEVVLREDHTVEHPLNIARGSIDHPDGIINFVALDCPSDPSLSRMGTSHRIQQALGSCDADLVFGDFNCPRHAASIQQAFPTHTHAFDHAGNGPIMTWPAEFPLLHLDHLLLNDRWTCVEYGTHRPDVGDHLPQYARMIRSTP